MPSFVPRPARLMLGNVLAATDATCYRRVAAHGCVTPLARRTATVATQSTAICLASVNLAVTPSSIRLMTHQYLQSVWNVHRILNATPRDFVVGRADVQTAAGATVLTPAPVSITATAMNLVRRNAPALPTLIAVPQAWNFAGPTDGVETVKEIALPAHWT